MKNEIDVVRDISAKFAQGRIAYMLTGSIAMNYYAQPRMTRDIDVVVALEAKQADAIVQLFGTEYYVAREAVSSSIEHESIFNLIHNETMVKVDCIIRKKDAYRLAEFQRRQQIQIHDFFTSIVSKEDLMISKLFWSKDSRSEMQFRDIKNLADTGYDAEYMKLWTRKLDLHSLWEELAHG
jgi:hypothetical protein